MEELERGSVTVLPWAGYRGVYSSESRVVHMILTSFGAHATCTNPPPWIPTRSTLLFAEPPQHASSSLLCVLNYFGKLIRIFRCYRVPRDRCLRSSETAKRCGHGSCFSHKGNYDGCHILWCVLLSVIFLVVLMGAAQVSVNSQSVLY